MTANASPAGRLARIFSWPRVRFVLVIGVVFGLLLGVGSVTSTRVWMERALVVSIGALLVFGLFEQWPSRLPRWIARWVLQVLGVCLSVPVAGYLAYGVTTGGNLDLLHDRSRLIGYGGLCFFGMLFGPWIALAALLRQREAFARDLALGFQLERSQLEHRASEARLRLLQAQVQPHFLFNTLANVRALVRTGSPQAGVVLDSLIAYLRASVPHLESPFTTLAQELELVRAYLELMHMRMPDRLQYALHVDGAVAGVDCPPLTLLTLVENAVRHGVDPSEAGGRIDVSASVHEGRCIARVVDTGVGLQHAVDGLGSGLATLRERLKLAFGGDARLSLTGVVPHGVSAEVEFPVRRGEAA